MGKQRITKKQKETIFIYRALSVRIFAFIMLLGGIVGLLFFFRPEVSDVEKRTLTKFPTPTVSSLWDGQFFYDLSLWYSDTYPMRDGLIAVDQKIENAYGITSSTMMVGSRQISDDIPDIEEEKTDDSSEQPQEVEQISAPDSRAMESEIQKQILNLYESDFSKHTPDTELARLRMVWNSVPIQLAKENRKFFFGQIRQGARAKDFELAIEWLLDCGLVGKVYRVEKPAVPLKAYVDFSAFKLFLLDVGLLGAMSELDARSILEGNELFTEFKGALTEQYVYQQLVAETGYTPYYFSSSSHTEIDFLIQKEGEVVPVEVKAEENLRAKSLRAYCEKYHPRYAVRISMANYRQQDWLLNLPLYAVENL